MKPETQKTLHASRFTLHERGFTILEIIAATFVITLIVGGVYSLVVFNLRASGDVARHLEAAYLQEEYDSSSPMKLIRTQVGDVENPLADSIAYKAIWIMPVRISIETDRPRIIEYTNFCFCILFRDRESNPNFMVQSHASYPAIVPP